MTYRLRLEVCQRHLPMLHNWLSTRSPHLSASQFC